LLNEYDNLISDKHKIASIFNTFFTNEATDIIANCNSIMNNFKRSESNELNNNCYNIITNSIYLKSIEPDEMNYLISKCSERSSFHERLTCY